MFFTSIITIIWALDKGFQLRDEGLYILSARFPEDFKFNVSAIYVYTGLLFKISGYNLVTFNIDWKIGILAVFKVTVKLTEFHVKLQVKLSCI